MPLLSNPIVVRKRIRLLLDLEVWVGRRHSDLPYNISSRSIVKLKPGEGQGVVTVTLGRP